jgi:hypothetical protein
MEMVRWRKTNCMFLPWILKKNYAKQWFNSWTKRRQSINTCNTNGTFKAGLMPKRRSIVRFRADSGNARSFYLGLWKC